MESTTLANFTTEATETETSATDEADQVVNMLAAAMLLPEYQAAVWMGKVGRGIMYITGLIGNFLSGLVMFQKKNQTVSCYFYMGLLSIFDSLAILFSCVIWILSDLTNTVLSTRSHALLCKVVWPLLAGSILTGTYLILLMTFDRYLAVRFPLKAASWCTRRRAKISSVVLIVCCYVFRAPYFAFTDPIRPMQCAAFQGRMSEVEQAYRIINFAVSFYIPFVALSVLNILIIKTLIGREKQFESGGYEGDDTGGPRGCNIECASISESISSTSVSTNQSRRSRSTAASSSKTSTRATVIMLLMISFSFLILTSPLQIFYLVYASRSYTDSPQSFAVFTLTLMIVYILYQINHCANFFLYCVSGRKFRNDLRLVLKCEHDK